MKKFFLSISLCLIFMSIAIQSNAQCTVQDDGGNVITGTNVPFNTNLIPNPGFEDMTAGEADCWTGINTPDFIPINEDCSFINGNTVGTGVSYDNDPNNENFACVMRYNSYMELIQLDLGYDLPLGQYNFSVWVKECTNFAFNDVEISVGLNDGEYNNLNAFGQSVVLSMTASESMIDNDDFWIELSGSITVCQPGLNQLGISSWISSGNAFQIAYTHLDGLSLELANCNEVDLGPIVNVEPCINPDLGSLSFTSPIDGTYSLDLLDLDGSISTNVASNDLVSSGIEETVSGLINGGYLLTILDQCGNCSGIDSVDISNAFAQNNILSNGDFEDASQVYFYFVNSMTGLLDSVPLIGEAIGSNWIIDDWNIMGVATPDYFSYSSNQCNVSQNYNNSPSNLAYVCGGEDFEGLYQELAEPIILGNYSLSYSYQRCSPNDTEFGGIDFALSSQIPSVDDFLGVNPPEDFVIINQDEIPGVVLGGDWVSLCKEVLICDTGKTVFSFLPRHLPPNTPFLKARIDGISLQLIDPLGQYTLENTGVECNPDPSGFIEFNYTETGTYLIEGPNDFSETGVTEQNGLTTISNLLEGEYVLTVLDEEVNCPLIDTIVIDTILPLGTLTTSNLINETCPFVNDGAFSFTYSQDASYSVFLQDEFNNLLDITINDESLISGASIDISGLSEGDYVIIVIDPDNDCEVTDAVTIGLEESSCCEDPSAQVTHINNGEDITWNNLTDEFYAGIMVHDGGILRINNSDLSFGSDVQIVVEIGGYLEVNNSEFDTVENCNVQWGGIEVHGNTADPQEYDLQGFIQITESTINNARVGISMGELDANFNRVPNRGGCFGKYDMVRFNNNEKDLWIFDHNGGDFLKFSSLVSQLNDDYFASANFPATRIELENAEDVLLTNCFLGNENDAFFAEPEVFSLTGVRAVNAPFRMASISPNIIDYPEDAILSYIIGFPYGIRATGGGIGFYEVEKVRMFCYRGIFMNTTEETNLYRNQLFPIYNSTLDEDLLGADLSLLETIGYTDIQGDFNDPYLLGSYGIYLTGNVGADVQENLLNGNGFAQSSGIILNNTFNRTRPLYNNKIYKYDTGIKLLNRNRENQFQIPGAEFRCNDLAGNVLDVEINAELSTCTDCGASQNQGANGESANNFFDDNYDLVDAEQLVNFLETGVDHNYNRWSQYVETQPIQSETYNYEFIVVDFANPCDSQLPPSDWPFAGMNTTSDKNDLYTEFTGAKAEWDYLVDGGDTEALTEEVLNAEFSDALVLYYDLMSKSPNLSEQVMIEALEKEYDLPMVLLKQILASNPQAAKSSKVQKGLDDRLMPLPEYMREEINEGLTWVSQKETLESEMNELRRDYRGLERLEMLTILKDSNIIDKITPLEALISQSDFPETPLEECERLIGWNRLSEAQVVIGNVLPSLSIESQEFERLSAIDEVLEYALQLDEETISFETIAADLTNLAHDPEFTASAYAQSLIEKHSGSYFYEDVFYPQVSMNYRGSESEDNPQKISLLKTYPNPATNVLVIEKQDIPLTNSATFEIMDINGSLFLKQDVNSDTQQVLDISKMSSGNYYILLKDQGELICKQAFIKL
ncbi:MAG: T9SS type A sorting domain-containing protein [Flavobacteriales bacterium]